MTPLPGSPTPQDERATLGRLGGFAPSEADRGEKALWLAGGGYRAALFHLGALTRLNELGMLGQLGTVGAVSGGGIMAALLETRVPWPLYGAYRDWPERVAEPLREIARRNARVRALLRRPFRGTEAVLEERYARELAGALGGGSGWGPRFVFGASGLTLSGLAAGWEDCLEWRLQSSVHPPGYEPRLVAETIAAVRTDLDAFGEAEQAVLENHGYLVADAALRKLGLTRAGGIQTQPPEPPHPEWMDPERVRAGLAASSRRTLLGRLRPRRAGLRPRRAQPTRPELTELLDRHRPLLQYDSVESWRADSVETICTLAVSGRCNSLHRADGTAIASADPGEGEARLDLGFLGASYGNGEPASRDDYLDECGGSHAADALAGRREQGRADVIYGHARHDEQGALWLQYWLFFYFADRGLLGVERREGDWQLVQLRLGGSGEPEEVTFAQRDGAERLLWEQATRASTDQGGAALVVYPARGSHQPRPRAGSFEAAVVSDHNDGLGPLLRPRLEAIGDAGPGWVLWPGRWGSTRRRERFEADSPRGPREQQSWWDPAALHAAARPWEERPAHRPAPPPRLHLEARRDAGVAVVSYEFLPPADDEAAPARIVAAPFDGSGNPSTSHAFAAEGRRGKLALQLPPERGWSGIRASATSADGAPGETVVASFATERERAG